MTATSLAEPATDELLQENFAEQAAQILPNLDDKTLAIAREHFDEAFIFEHEQLIQEIADNIPGKLNRSLYLCSSRPKYWNLEAVADFAKRHGKFGELIFQNLDGATLYYEKKCGNFFAGLGADGSHAAKRIARYINQNILDNLNESRTRRLLALPLTDVAAVLLPYKAHAPFAYKPHLVIGLIERYGTFTSSLLERNYEVGTNKLVEYERADRSRLKRLMHPKNKALRTAYAKFVENWQIDAEELLQNAEKIEQLCKRYGEAACKWYKLSGQEIFELEPQHRKLYQSVHATLCESDLESYTGATLNAIKPEIIGYEESIQKLVRYTHENSASILKLLTDEVLSKHKDTIELLVYKCRSFSYQPVKHFIEKVPEDIKQDTELLHHLIEHCSDTIEEVFKHFPYQQLKEHRQEFMDLATKYGNLFGNLCTRWKTDILDQEQEWRSVLERAIDNFGELADEYLDAVTQDSWDALLEEVAERHGAAAPRIIEAFSKDYWQIEEEDYFQDFRAVRAACRKEFGITHYERLVRIEKNKKKRLLNYDLLEENLKNLNPDYNDDRPIAIFALAETDHNGGFVSDDMFEALTGLSEEYKLFIVEARDKEELSAHIKRVAELHGKDETGRPVKPVDLMVVAAHGSTRCAQLSCRIKRVENDGKAALEYDSGYLTHKDGEAYEQWRPYFTDKTLMGLISCRVARGGFGKQNLAMALHTAIPNIAIDASRQICSLNHFIRQQGGHVAALSYSSVAEAKVLRIRKGVPMQLVKNTVTNLLDWQELDEAA